MASGQGHETSFAQLVTEWLGVPFDSITYVAHDTTRVAAGGGSHSGRSMKLATTIIGQATDDIIDKGRTIASVLLETDEADIAFDRGTTALWAPIARSVCSRWRKPLLRALICRWSCRGCSGAVSDQTLPVASFPYGSQVCEVEVDVETGAVTIVGYVAVDDVGRAINPLILHGQTHGGIAQGVGQARLRTATTTLTPGSFLRRASWTTPCRAPIFSPRLTTALSEVPSPTNRLGVRSGGEGGTTPALAVVVNAIVDALAELGVRHIEMPAMLERVWRAIRDARAARP